MNPSHGGPVYPVLGALHPEQSLSAHLDAGNGSKVIGCHQGNLGAANRAIVFPQSRELNWSWSCWASWPSSSSLSATPGLDNVVVVLAVAAVPGKNNIAMKIFQYLRI